MKYTLAIVMLLGLAATEVQATESFLEKAKGGNKHTKLAHKKKEEESESEQDSDDEDSGDEDDSDKDQDAPTSSLVQMEEEENDNEDDDEDSEEDDDDEDDDEESEGSDDEDGEGDKKEGEEKEDKKTLVQLDGDDDVDHSGEFFKSTEHDMLGDGGYKRVTTTRFAADNDDIFMRSMIEQYALEGKNKDGSPNGQFWMDEANTRAAAAEVLNTHKGLKGAELDKYLKTYFPRSWAHFDVNRGGKVEVIKMPQFMRFIASDQQMYLW